ncbi:MAG: hypothetical protein Kow0089_02820 [Desulfobulbaceae bacterium]
MALQQDEIRDQPRSLQLLHGLHLLISSARVYGDNSRMVVESVQRFRDLLASLVEEDDEVVLLAASGRFYLQQEKVPHVPGLAALINGLLDFFERRKVKGLRFYPAVVETDASAIAAFARLFDRCLHEEEPGEWLEEQLGVPEFSWVEPILYSDAELEEALLAEQNTIENLLAREVEQKQAERDPEQERKRKAMLAYGYALHSLQEVSRKVSSDKKASIKKALRMVHIMIDTVAEDSNVMLSLSTIRDYDDYTFTHSLNVAILSMCLGNRIGLSKQQLERLSLSALFHDLGKVDVPKSILNKPGLLNDHEFREMRNHSVYSVRQIILLKASHQRRAEIMLPPFEHHLKFDLSGYPQTPRKKPISLFGRIICIADVFDAITARRVYRTFPISPDRALAMMMEGAGRDFDPLLLKVFINMIGLYPVGTLLKLDGGELGLVAKYGGGDEQEKDLWVQLLRPRTDGGFDKGELINMGPLNPKTGRFNRPVLETLHPAACNIQPADFLL